MRLVVPFGMCDLWKPRSRIMVLVYHTLLFPSTSTHAATATSVPRASAHGSGGRVTRAMTR